MTIPFNQMPANFRLPGGYIEISNLLASQGEQEFKVLMFGQRLAAGTVAAGVATQVTNAADADTFFGRGSMLANMLRAGINVDPYMSLWAIALDDDGAGVAATGKISFAGPATAAGTLMIYIAGQAVKVGVATGDTADAVATSTAAAINAVTSLPVTAVVNDVTTSEVDITARHKGIAGNGIDIRLNYYGESTPAGVIPTITAMAGGATNPDIATAIAAIGADWYNWIVMPYSDTANVVALETELNALWGPTLQRDARAFGAYNGNHADTATFGGTRNCPHVTWLGANSAPQPVWILAAINAMTAANPLALDPARPLHTLPLTGMLAPARTDRWDDTDRNLLLFDGIATYTVSSDDTCRIERQVTSYQKNTAGLDDVSYLDINRPETLSRIRYQQRSAIASQFIAGRFKLASDNNARFGAGQPIITADIVKAWLLALYADFIELGWAEDLAGYKATIVIEIDTADGRINWKDEPRLIGQARTFAGLMEFHI
jgi:phage tail sheath gpL-like